VNLIVEVAGCPTVCRHCWAQGTSYGEMPVDDAAFVLDAAAEICVSNGRRFDAYPMHEVAAHSRAADILRLFADRVGADQFEPLSTTGVPIATREDWRDVLGTAAELGTTTVWVALHGAPVEHDRVVIRIGGYEETREAVRRIHAAGLRAGCNIFVTKANLNAFDEFADAVKRLELDETAWEPAMFFPTRRGRRYGTLHPELADLEPVAQRVAQWTSFWRRAWADLPALAEAAWVRKAVTASWPADAQATDAIRLVCRPNLDVHSGTAGLYGTRHGNLRRDDPAAVLERGLAHGAVGDDVLFFGCQTIPPVDELADRVGDPGGREIHFHPVSVRNRWLHRMAA
jgi:hypothetical protein